MIGSTIRQHCSTSSVRMNSVGSPSSASSSSRSYASGDSSRNVSSYEKSMLAVRTRNEWPGTFAPKRSEMPSFGLDPQDQRVRRPAR